MGSIFRHRRQGLKRVVLALLWLAGPASSAAQTAGMDGDPVTLDRKNTSRLLLKQVAPEYPTLAKLNYIQGEVRVQLLVSPEGRVAQAHVIRGHPFLAVSALKAVRRWLYRPFVTEAGPAPFQTTVSLNFTLRARRIELIPRQAERDLDRRVQPPAVLAQWVEDPPTSSVRLRLLLNDQGQVIDVDMLRGSSTELEAAARNLRRWTFRPARWGALPVPWYLEVDVPVQVASPHQAAADPSDP